MSSSYIVRLTALGPRVRGLRARYLTREALNTLIHAQTIDDAMNALKSTDYGAIIERLGKVASEDQVANEVRTHIIKFISLLAASVPEPASTVLRSYLMRLEFENVKVIARSLISGFEGKPIEGLINIAVEEELSRRHILAMIMGVRDIEDLRNRLLEIRHPAGPALDSFLRINKQFPQYSIMLIDTLIDKAFIEFLSRLIRIDNSVSKFVQSLVDYYNVNILLRSKLWSLPQEMVNELIIREGPVASIALKVYGEAAARILEDVVTVFPLIDELIKVAGSSDLRSLVQYLGPFDYVFSKYLEERMISLFTEFSPGAALAAVHFKFVEGELVIALLNAFLEGLSRDFVIKLYSPVI
ncbi:MAG: V-type ATPase subunit [Vulcanisaeta sp. AZ3]